MSAMFIFAGPNGSGKTTIARRFEARLDTLNAERINADEIAQDMLDRFGGKLEDHSLAAAQESDRRVMQAIADKRSFAVETVLSSNKFIKMIQAAKAAGFLVVTIFVYLRDPKTNISRIENRVAQGGHPVPDEKVRSRHPKSLKNLEWASSMSDFTYVFENDRDGYGIIAATRFHDGWAANEAAAYEGFKSCVRPLWTQLGFARLP